MSFRSSFCRLWFALLILAAAASTSPLQAQLRVVTYNTYGNPGSSSDSDWDTVLEAIGNEQVGGIAHPISIMALQEVDQKASGANAQDIATILNNIYGVSTYHAVTASDGDGWNTQSLVYDSSQVTLLGTSEFDMGTRPGWRGQFIPVGYSSRSAYLYAYSVHLKAYDDKESQRAYESSLLRANGDSLGASANIIYAGDFNLTGGGSEQAYANMLAAGYGQAVDPENGDFSDLLKKSYSSDSTYIRSRLDFQFLSTEMVDQEGLDLVDGSYHVFGRKRSGSYYYTSPSQLEDASDHLPVVADYQLPAIMGAELGTVPEALDLGQTFNLDVTISNLADVVAALGADELDYTLSVTGDLVGSASGSVLALSGGQVQYVTLDTSTAGTKSGNIVLSSTSTAVEHPSITLPVSFEVLAAGLPGDFNDDGIVDAIDYTVWRDGLGTTYTAADYDLWKSHFGETAASGTALAGGTPVPEPSTFGSLLLGLLALPWRRQSSAGCRLAQV